jgi:hypothetical protein
MLAYAVREPASLPPGLQAAVSRILQRDVLQKSRTSGHFTVHYDTVGSQAAAMLDSAYQAIPGSANEYADSVLAIANRVYAIEISELGYATPPTDGTLGGGPEHDIYVQDLPNEYGETFPEIALDSKMYAGGQWITFVRIDNDFSFVRPPAAAEGE